MDDLKYYQAVYELIDCGSLFPMKENELMNETRTRIGIININEFTDKEYVILVPMKEQPPAGYKFDFMDYISRDDRAIFVKDPNNMVCAIPSPYRINDKIVVSNSVETCKIENPDIVMSVEPIQVQKIKHDKGKTNVWMWKLCVRNNQN